MDNELLKKQENTIIVGVSLSSNAPWEIEEHLDELERLAETAGATVVGRVTQERSKVDSKYFIGKGKIEEISQFVEENKIAMVIFDDDLSSSQIRNIENKVKSKIVDRSALILDIFASHARSRESKTQVELAQLQYQLTRLTKQWTHLSRQVGGIGTKGPGETQLETDRRLVRTRIQKLKTELEKIEKQRGIRRVGRKNFFKVALVGYTNAGKSTIMNLLSKADVLVENKLFATLDSTVRKVYLEHGKEMLLSDTVGFIRKLPHNLVASFKSTLEEAKEANVLLHVVDVGQENFEEHIQVVNQVLNDLEISEKNIVLVFNKIDILEKNGQLSQLKKRYANAVFISAKRNMGILQFKQKILSYFDVEFITSKWEIPVEKSQLRTIFFKYGEIIEEQVIENSILQIISRIQKEKLEKLLQQNQNLKEFICEED